MTADKNKHPIEVERPMTKDSDTPSGVPEKKAATTPIVPHKGKDKRVDFQADARRIASLDGHAKSMAGIVITDKKVVSLPNGLKAENN